MKNLYLLFMYSVLIENKKTENVEAFICDISIF